MSLEDKLAILEDKIHAMEKEIPTFVSSEMNKKWKILPQAQAQFGMHLALCVDTIDPWKQNRVRFFSPLLHDPNTPVKSLPWAYPISVLGGFDDCGVSWVPPAGSTLCLVFENGDRQAPYYIGTTWHRDRGPEGNRNFGFNIEEFYKIHEGHRKGYLVGDNDGSQVLPPWNTESANGFDIDSIAEFESDPEAQKRITYPNICGFKTAEKHSIKFVNGNYKCNHKNKRIEIFSSCGNHLIMKDDHIHNSGTWTHPSCNNQTPSSVDCADKDGNPIENLNCEGAVSNPSIQHGHPSTPEGTAYGLESNRSSNEYYKQAPECRPYKGPGTPQNNKVMLPQTGVQLSSISGHTFLMDDSVQEPRGIPNWERSLQPFDFGCNNIFLGRIMCISATGHKIIMSDQEDETELRGENNYIRLISALGNRIELNDHTKQKEQCIAGKKRGITLQSTSNHTIQMIDEDNEVSCPVRKDGGIVAAKAKRAFVRIRSGYGLQISLNDFQGGDNGSPGSQEETINQNIQIFCPQKDNTIRGPHIMRFQEKATGPGQIFLKAGGDYICMSYDKHTTIVGQFDDNPSDKLVLVSGDYLEYTKEKYINIADVHYFLANKIIALLAGRDNVPTDAEPGDNCVPIVGPVLIATPKGIVMSDRLYSSASGDAPCASIFQLKPFCACPPPEQQCSGGVV